jgi:hypothetical protein
MPFDKCKSFFFSTYFCLVIKQYATSKYRITNIAFNLLDNIKASERKPREQSQMDKKATTKNTTKKTKKH